MTDTRRRTRGAGSVFRDKNGTWHYRRELDRDPATGRPRRIEAKGRTKAEARTRFDAKAAEMERTGLMPGAKSPLLKDYCERWLADYRTRVNADHGTGRRAGRSPGVLRGHRPRPTEGPDRRTHPPVHAHAWGRGSRRAR